MVARLLRVARQRWRALVHRDAVDDELARELGFHLEQLTQEFVERGLSEREAHLAARRAIGNIPLLVEQSRDTRMVGCTGDAQIVISNPELEKLIIRVFKAIDSPVDVRSLRSFVMSRHWRAIAARFRGGKCWTACCCSACSSFHSYC